MNMERLGGHVVVEQLIALGADMAFCVPGESYLSVLDGLYEHADQIRLITARQEGGAAFMASAYGKLTGRPGICLVTRGPGAANASIGVHVSRQDASPMILFVGQISTEQNQREAFQEVDYGAMFGTLAKEVLIVNHASRVPELVARAYGVAVSGEPGPVVVVLPEDVLTANVDVSIVAPVPPVVPAPSPAAVDEFVARIADAKRPVLVLGGSGWTPEASSQLRRFAESRGLPVATATRHQDLFDNNSDVYAGTLGLGSTPGLDTFVSEADLIAMIGTRPDALTAKDFSLLSVPTPSQQLLHVHPDPQTLHRIYRANLAIPSGPTDFAAALQPADKPVTPSEWARRLRENYLRSPKFAHRGVDPAPFMAALNARLPPDAILTAGAGNYTLWHQMYHRYTTFPSQVSTQSGAMGFGLPAAIAAKLTHPAREVVAFAGDGCFLMTGQELATAAQCGIGVLIVVVNNSSYGTIRMHQERRYPGRVSGTDVVNPDFAAFARSFGARAERVSTPEEFAAALHELLPASTLSLIEIDVG